jgi:phospholipid/cholesterol/gamma-HCH transport system substrate-binding protein
MSRIARLGAFIFAGLVVFAASIFLIGEKEFLFSSTYELSSLFDNVAGLVNGAEVRVGGVHMGTVDHINMPKDPHGKVMVVMKLKNSTRSVIRKDSIASIMTEGLLGNKFVTISFGSDNAEPVKDGDTIQSQPPVDLSDLIEKSGEVLDRTKLTLQNVEAATGHLNSVAEKVDRGKGTIGQLVNDRAVYAQAKEGVTSFQENMEALKQNWFFRGFFKDRGYVDSAEISKNEISQLPSKQPLKKFTTYSKDLFDKPTTADLKNDKLLKSAGEFLQQNPFHLAAVTAYTGYSGEKDKNLQLSRAQAMVVRLYLVGHFKIDDSRVKTKGMGEDNKDDPKKAGRVEILIY